MHETIGFVSDEKNMSISRGNVPFLGRFPRLIDTFLLTGEDFLLTKLQVGASVEYGKTTNTTFTTCNNLHASHVAILLQGKQRNTTLRQDKMSGNVQGEALFIVVKVVQVVFPTQQAVLETTQTPLSLKYRMSLPN